MGEVRVEQRGRVLLAAYVEALERTGELPGYDRAALERAVETGSFRPSA